MPREASIPTDSTKQASKDSFPFSANKFYGYDISNKYDL